MSSLLKNITKLKIIIRLGPEKQTAIKNRLSSHIDAHPVRAGGLGRQLWQKRPFLSLFSNLKRMQIAAIISLIVVLAGGGISAAAEGAVPGDALYKVKTKITEPVRAGLAISTKAKAKWEMKRAERRLNEAAELSAEGRLSAEARTELEQKFKQAADRTAAHLKEMDNRGQATVAAELAGEFESRLNAQVSVFGRINGTSGQETTGVINNIHNALEVVVPLRVKLEAETSGSANAADRRSAAEGKMTAAANVIAEAERFIAKKKAALGSAATAQAEAKLTLAKSVQANAAAKFEAEMYAEAFTLSGNALRTAQEAKALVELTANLNLDLQLNGEIKSDIQPTGQPEESGGSGSVEVETNGTVDVDVEGVGPARAFPLPIAPRKLNLGL